MSPSPTSVSNERAATAYVQPPAEVTPFRVISPSQQQNQAINNTLPIEDPSEESSSTGQSTSLTRLVKLVVKSF